jgi:Spy/CpxP family protein refolding chaperone
MIKEKCMKKAIWMSALGLALAQVVSAPASAQLAQGQGRGQAGLASIPVDLLAEPLKLTGDQKAKIKASQEKAAKAMAEARAANAEITAVLTGEQKAKVDGVVREFGSYPHVGIPLQILGELKLTDDQRSKIRPIAEEMQKRLQGLRAAGGQSNLQAMQQMRQGYVARVKAILTAEQQATIEKWRKANPGPRAGGNPPS